MNSSDTLLKQHQTINWQPTATIETLRTRAKILAKIRDFFAQRNVMEVETPIMAQYGITDPFIEAIRTANGKFLQTSPEYHMKRLLAAGSGSIFQMGKCFRAEEAGRFHNSEFTMLEWYRINFDHIALMDEVDQLLQQVLGCASAERISYRECFTRYVGDIDPHTASQDELASIAKKFGIDAPSVESRDDWLTVLMSHVVEPQLGIERPVLLHDYPADQAALARVGKALDGSGTLVAHRFEAYFKGVELANGYFELTEGSVQRQRFDANRRTRAELGLPDIAPDEALLAAIDSGLPHCAGVALGVDRLLMLRLNASHIREVLSFVEESLDSQ